MAPKKHREPKEGEETIKGSAPFRKVYYLMWEDRELRRLSHIEKVTWLICLTGSHTTMLPGLASVSVMRLADQVGASVAATNKALKQLEALGWIEFDRNMEVLRVVNAFKYNVPSNGDMVRGWIREWLRIPACELRAKHLEAFKHVIAGSPTLVAIMDEEIALGRFENRDKVRAYQRPAAGKPQDSQDTVSTPSQDSAGTVSTSVSRKQEEGSSKASSLPTVETRQSTLCDPPLAVAESDEDFGPAPVEQPTAAVATTQPPDRKPRQPKLVLTGEAPSSRKPANPEHAQIVADMGRWLDRYRVWRSDPKATVPFPVFAQAWKARGIDDLMLALDGLRDDDFGKTCAPKALLSESMIAKGIGFARNGKPRPTNPYEDNLEFARALGRQAKAAGEWMPPKE
jgi:predicted transcriptional regulator